MDLLTLLGPVLSLSILIERILEALFSVMEMTFVTKAIRESETYPKGKQIASILLGGVFGVVIANILAVGFLELLHIDDRWNSNRDGSVGYRCGSWSYGALHPSNH